MRETKRISNNKRFLAAYQVFFWYYEWSKSIHCILLRIYKK